MANYFSSVFTSENTDSIPSLNKDPLPDVPSIQVHPEGNLLTNLDAKNSGGPHNLPARF